MNLDTELQDLILGDIISTQKLSGSLLTSAYLAIGDGGTNPFITTFQPL